MNQTINIILVAASCSLLGCSGHVSEHRSERSERAHMADIKDKNQLLFYKMVDESSEVYDAIANGPRHEVPTSVRNNTRCIAVMPNVMTGAFVVGGTHGEGLASCRDDNNNWSQPAAISLNQGSIGLQAGAKSVDLVLFFQSKEAMQALKRGNFSLGADVSAVAGNYDSAIDTKNAGVLVYSRTEGLFAGVSVNGGKIGSDDTQTKRNYGRKVNYRTLLENREYPDATGYTTKLTKLFPR
jgi:lipid-binding SYLF domain-containing protein